MKRIAVASACLLVTIAVSCNSKPTAPPRPSLIPNAAVWAGGVDGGSFFECDVDTAHDVNRCLVYNDSTGDVAGGGFFRLSGANRAARADELQFQFFDGDDISLSVGTLVPVPPIRPHGIPQDSMFANGLFIYCSKVVSSKTDCSIYRPDGSDYFRGTFVADSASTDKLDYKFFDLSDRTINLVGGGALVAK
jgi:hypothetical protein